MNRDPIDIQFGLVHDCVRACIFADHISRTKPKEVAWLSIADMCYADAIISWNAIFGTDSQDSHWKKHAQLFEVPDGSKLKPFGLEMILAYLKTTKEQWRLYHTKLVAYRNDRLAHFSLKSPDPDPPDLTWALKSACLYRRWLTDVLRAQKSAGKEFDVTSTTEAEMLALFKTQISEVCQ